LQPFRSIALPPLAAIASSFINAASSILAVNSQHTHQKEDIHALHAAVMGRRHNKSAESIMPRTQEHSSVHTGLTTHFRITLHLKGTKDGKRQKKIDLQKKRLKAMY
jgi:hypothetical protein